MLYKAGTVKEMEKLRENIPDLPEEVYGEALRLVKMLDEVYGAGRDVDNGDGGFVLIAENVQDLALVSQRYVDVGSNRHEAASVVQCGRKAYINAFFICNNEFGINILMPMSIAPDIIIGGLKKSKNNR